MIPNVNLLPEYRSQSSLPYYLFIIGFIICIVLMLAIGGFFIHYKNQLSTAEEEYERLLSEKEMREQLLADLEAAQEETLAGAVRFAEQYLVPASPLIDEFESLLPNTSFLQDYRYDYGEVNITTLHDNKTDIATYTDRLVMSEFMSDVMLNNIEAVGLIDFEDDDLYHEATHLIEINRFRLMKEVANHE